MCKEPKISEVLIHMDAFLKSTKTNGKKKLFQKYFLITIKSPLFPSYLNKVSCILSFKFSFQRTLSQASLIHLQ